MTDRQCQIAIFGAGRIGKVHARNVVDPMTDSRHALAAQHGATYVDMATALGNAEVDAIIATSTNSTSWPVRSGSGGLQWRRITPSSAGRLVKQAGSRMLGEVSRGKMRGK
jgi:hypothetical protein